MCRRRWHRTTSSARSLRNTATTWRKAKVIRTDPEAGTELEKGATLTVYISKGKQKDDNENVSVPGLLGMTEDQARAALEGKGGLKIGSVDQVDSSAEAGSVVGSRRMPVLAGDQGAARSTSSLQGKSPSNNNSPDNGGGNSGGQDNGDGDYDDTPSSSAVRPFRFRAAGQHLLPCYHLCGRRDQYDDTCSTSGGSTIHLGEAARWATMMLRSAWTVRLPRRRTHSVNKTEELSLIEGIILKGIGGFYYVDTAEGLIMNAKTRTVPQDRGQAYRRGTG